MHGFKYLAEIVAETRLIDGMRAEQIGDDKAFA
jgi:hypothetical protein